MATPNDPRRFVPTVETLEDRTAPALIASQVPLAALPAMTLTTTQVDTLLQRAAAATGSDDAIIAIVDRAGNILGVRVEGGVSPALTGDADLLGFAIDGAVAKARTGAFFSSNADPLTSRTIQFISQTTITQREVESYTFDSNPSSTLGGPGFVAPIGLGGHFPPNIRNTPQVDLFAIEHTNRDMLVNAGASGILDTPDFSDGGDLSIAGRFNIDSTYIPAGKDLAAPLSYHDTLLSPTDQSDPAIAHVASRGIATLPGGLPIYEFGVLVGGIGVFFPGHTGFANEENSQLSADFDPGRIDRSMEAEFIALAAIGGSSQAGFPIGALGGVAALPGFDLPFPRIDLVGITLDTVGPGGLEGPQHLIDYANAFFSIGTGDPGSGSNQPVNAAGDPLVTGKPAPDGWLVTPHDGVSLSATQVQQIIDQGIAQANRTRAQIRPLGTTARMVFAVADATGEVLGLYRMSDAPVFSIDVAVAKARNTAYYNDPSQLKAIDKLPELPAGTALTARSFRYLALPRFPEGIDGSPPGPFSTLNDAGIDPKTGLNLAAPPPISAFTSVLGFDAFHPNTNFHRFSANANGVVFFPGSSGVYVNGKIVGGLGVSGDGVDEDDVVTSRAIAGFDAPSILQADNYFVRGVRLPYLKFNRNPEG
ncbi:MAG: heme-binding protein [Planctomycetes bacterium]|nr:heme-binding protein [Planctomycetota bacterium]